MKFTNLPALSVWLSMCLILCLICCTTNSTQEVAFASLGESMATDQKQEFSKAPLQKIRKGEVDPFNMIESVVFEKGRVVERTKEELSDRIYVKRDYKRKKERPKENSDDKDDKLHPLLRQYLKSKSEGSEIEIVINLRDRITIPRFAEMDLNKPRKSTYNRAVLEQNERLSEEIRERRIQSQEKIRSILRERDIKIIEDFWIINGFSARCRVGDLRYLMELEEVLYLDPVQTEDKPPQNGNNNDDVQDGRAHVVSDPYFNLGQTSGYIGLLDTGVDIGHELFNGPSNIDFMYDCNNGGSNCNNAGNPGFNPDDNCWNHGTKSAAIITANNTRGNNHRGVTGITLDNLKVYNGCSGLSTTAAVRGFERAVEISDRIIVAEMQGSGDHKSSIADAADNAFEAGAVIIAANGNNGPNANTVNCPANAHKAMGVGNYDVQTQAAINSQSRGPSDDDRFKPDFRCPTNSETASSAGPSSYGSFGGTSGATPYGAGVAALVRNFLRGNSWSIDPGKVYAYLINSSQNPYPFDNDIGAGDLQLPVNGHTWWGKTSISDGQTVEIPINISANNYDKIDMAIWWPEENFEWHGIVPYWGRHDDIDLRIINPAGNSVDASVSIPSVFERVRADGAIPTGTWKIRINGYDVKGNQEVYWNVTATR